MTAQRKNYELFYRFATALASTVLKMQQHRSYCYPNSVKAAALGMQSNAAVSVWQHSQVGGVASLLLYKVQRTVYTSVHSTQPRQ